MLEMLIGLDMIADIALEVEEHAYDLLIDEEREESFEEFEDAYYDEGDDY
jgi:hypothetical protein